MNYLSEIVAFDGWKEVNPLPATAIALWHELMSACNKSGWQEEFTVANGLLQFKAGLSRKEFDRARDILVSNRLIEYKKSNRVNQAGRYRINSIVQKGQQKGQREVQQEGQQKEHRRDNERDILFKPKYRLKLKSKTLKKNIVPPDAGTPPVEGKKLIFSPEHMGIAVYLKGWILKNKPDFKVPPRLDSWANTVRLMVEIDKRSLDRIRAVVDWCQADEFWCSNILSMDKLRKQFDKLEFQMAKRKIPAQKLKSLLPEPEIAWIEVNKKIDRYNAPEWSFPEIGEAVKAVGYMTILDSPNRSIQAGQFMRIYGALKKQKDGQNSY
jgi:hypothetical protein